MEDKNAFILSSEFRAFIIVANCYDFRGCFGYNWSSKRHIELLFRDLIMPFWALLFIKKNSMIGVWIREN